ncbi:MAG TPA: hypothetical protein VF749_18555 [Candidatus Acidoferrum sp.]
MELCRQALVENSKTVELGAERFPVRRTAKRGLRRPVSCWMAKAVESLSVTRAEVSMAAVETKSDEPLSSSVLFLVRFSSPLARWNLRSYHGVAASLLGVFPASDFRI